MRLGLHRMTAALAMLCMVLALAGCSGDGAGQAYEIDPNVTAESLMAGRDFEDIKQMDMTIGMNMGVESDPESLGLTVDDTGNPITGPVLTVVSGEINVVYDENVLHMTGDMSMSLDGLDLEYLMDIDSWSEGHDGDTQTVYAYDSDSKSWYTYDTTVGNDMASMTEALSIDFGSLTNVRLDAESDPEHYVVTGDVAASGVSEDEAVLFAEDILGAELPEDAYVTVGFLFSKADKSLKGVSVTAGSDELHEQTGITVFVVSLTVNSTDFEPLAVPESVKNAAEEFVSE